MASESSPTAEPPPKAHKSVKTGPMPTGRRWNDLPVPFFFQAPTADAFHQMEMRDDDVIMCSLTKGGTTWVHKILHQILHGVNEDGSQTSVQGIGSTAQVYPEAIVLRRGAPSDPEVPPSADGMRKQFFGEWGFEDDMCGQSAPRLISTHLPGALLPAQLLSPSGKGRLVVVLRNLKDVLSSLHFFRGEAKDGWLGNEHGPGSLERFIHPDSPNAYGSPFKFVSQMDEAVRSLQPSGRVLVVYYEDLIRDLDAQVARIGHFLGAQMSDAKRSAVVASTTFNAMKEDGAMKAMLLRKGGIGDWRNHMGAAEWARFDAAFDAALEGVALAEPLRVHQRMAVTGLPPPRGEHSMIDDPREWERFVRHTLVEGRLVRDTLIATNGGHFQRPPSEFTGSVMPPGTAGAKHVAQAGRYHLFVSGVCPWASSTRAARHMLGLEDVISMDVADGQSSSGWVLLGGTSCPPWAGRDGPFYLHEVYQASDPLGTTRITMPVLWDKQLGCIVSNDSWSIVKMLATSFRPLCTDGACDLMPAQLGPLIDETHAAIYSSLLNGVYKCGIGLLKGNSEFASAAAKDVYAKLDELEATLSSQRFLLGTSQPTAVDLRLTMTLLRFDAAYRFGFGLTGAKGGVLVGDTSEGAPGYPVLGAYVRDMYAHIQPTVDWAAYRQYFRWAVGLRADQPLPDLARIADAATLPHGRAALPVTVS